MWGWEQNHIKITIQKVWKLCAGIWKCFFFSIRKKFQLPSFAQQSKAAIKLWVWSYKEIQTFKELLPGLIPKLWRAWLWTDNSGGWSTLLHMHLHTHTHTHGYTPTHLCIGGARVCLHVPCALVVVVHIQLRTPWWSFPFRDLRVLKISPRSPARFPQLSSYP